MGGSSWIRPPALKGIPPPVFRKFTTNRILRHNIYSMFFVCLSPTI